MSGLSTADVNVPQEKLNDSPTRSMLRFAVCALVVFAAAGYSSSFTPGPWYGTLRQPVGTPPNWVFAPVWSVLYSLLAISVWWFWEQSDDNDPSTTRIVRWGLGLFAVQLVLNALWSQLFFGWHWIGVALVDISLLWLSIAGLMFLFRKRSPLASALLIPYLIWVGYATYLNASFLVLNAA